MKMMCELCIVGVPCTHCTFKEKWHFEYTFSMRHTHTYTDGYQINKKQSVSVQLIRVLFEHWCPVHRVNSSPEPNRRWLSAEISSTLEECGRDVLNLTTIYTLFNLKYLIRIQDLAII